MGAALVIVELLHVETDDLSGGVLGEDLVLVAQVDLAVEGEVTAGTIVVIIAGGLLALSLLQGALLVDLVASGELRSDLLGAGAVAVS